MPTEFSLGSLTLPHTAGLAPMAGVADRAYRILCKEHHASLLVSEMISAKGLCYGDPKTAQFCTITDAERPMVQIVLPYQPDWIDINMGCPVHKVVATGAGSALMQKPDLAADIVRAAVSVSPVPITVKFRAGWDETNRNAVTFARKMEQAGAAAVAVHGRTKAQLYAGKADWGIIQQVKQTVSIPVIGNGDVTNAESCFQMYEQTGCDLVMVGRGSYGNPFVFSEIAAAAAGQPYRPPTLAEKMDTMLYHIRLILKLTEGKPPELAIREARKHAAWYISGLHGAAAFRARCYQLQSYAEAEQLAADVKEANPS